MGRTELPWRIMGRVARPFHLAVALATFVVAAQYLLLVPPGGESIWTHATGAVAAFATFILAASWWVKSDRMAEWGLLLSAGVWVARGVLWGTVLGWSEPSVWFALAWVIGAAGAYVLEVTDPDGRRGQHE